MTKAKVQKKFQHEIAQRLYVAKAEKFLEVALDFFGDYDRWNSPIGVLSDTECWSEIEPLFDHFLTKVKPLVESHLKKYAGDVYSGDLANEDCDF
jgi:hypothetical protein